MPINSSPIHLWWAAWYKDAFEIQVMSIAPSPPSEDSAFNTVALVGRYEDPRVADSLRALAEHLAGSDRDVLVDARADFDLPSGNDPPLTRIAESEYATRADLIVAVGGDGTMLHAARIACAGDIPLLGVNLGRLGFLADISPQEMQLRLDDVLAGRYVVESRGMLSASIDSPGTTHALSSLALNDIVLQKWETGRMLDFETWIDGQYVNTHGGDGLVVATATGSTAYALSCGGPILHPALDALVVVPICPHTLSDRPIVVRSNSEIEIRLIKRPNSKAQITCDGLMLGDLTSQDRLIIRPATQRVSLLHPPGHDYYRILRSKLHWGRGGQSEEVMREP